MNETKQRRRAILFQNNDFSGGLTRDFLRSLGFEVTWAMKILELHETWARCTCIDPEKGKLETVVDWGPNAPAYDVAFVDTLSDMIANNQQPGIDGWLVLPELGGRRIPRILIADKTENELMQRDYGGEFAINYNVQFRPDAFKWEATRFLIKLGLVEVV